MMPPPAIVLPAIAPLDMDRFLSCLAVVESRGDTSAVGLAGELGAWQFTRTAWEEETTAPFELASNETFAREIARQRVNRLRFRLLEAHFDPGPYNLALSWNAGLGGVILGKWQPSWVRDRALRVENLYRNR